MVMGNTPHVDRDLLKDVLKHSHVLKELQGETLIREELERRLDVSSGTCYRYTNWLSETNMVAESGKEIDLTPLGETIAAEVTTLETAVRRTLQPGDEDREELIEVVRLSPGLQALSRRALDRREVERRLDVSKTTGYRITRALEDRALIEKSNGRYALTPAGTEILGAVSTFETNVRTAIRLGPVLEALRDTGPPIDLDAFADATVTTVQGFTYTPHTRALELSEKSETLRLLGHGIVWLFLGDVRQRIADGLEHEHIMAPEHAAGHIADFPEQALEICNSDNVTLYVHDDLWYSLVIFDDRIGIGVRAADSEWVQTFVDTASPAARTWAEAVYESYKAEAVHLPRLDPIALEQTIEELSVTDPNLPNP
jgi:predicted transcriptional regulator